MKAELTKVPVCPHCEKELLDMHNGSDPGEWWNNEYIPDGDLVVECDHCHEKFTLYVEWEAYFTSCKIGEERE